jgi:hypothetical protein
MAVLPVVAIVVSLGPVRAQDDQAAAGLSIPVFGVLQGDDGDQGTFQGIVSSLVFSGDGELVLDGVLNGIATIGEDSVRISDQDFSSPVEPSVAGTATGEDGASASPEASVSGVRAFLQENPTQPEPDAGKCDVLFLDIQPIELNLLGLEVLTSRITVDANAIPGEGNLAGNLVCALAGLLDGLPETLGDVTDQLNELVGQTATAAPTDGLGALPIFGTFEDENGETGTFQGTITDLVFSEDGGTIVDGVLNGVTNVGDTVTRVVDEPITSPVMPSVGGSIPSDQYGNSNGIGTDNQTEDATTQPTQATNSDNPTQPEPDPDKCDVLYLDIQPITLNLLGLEVLTSRITVDVNAIPGEGNLAGNLVCALAGLLDGTPDAIAEITNQLNDIVNELGVAPTADDGTPTADDATDTTNDATTELTPTAASGETGADEPTQPAAEPTTAPAEPTEAPAEPTEPAEPTTAPAEPTEAPAEPTTT